MKKLFSIIIISLSLIISSNAADIPKGKNYANDFANVLTAETENHINNTGKNYQATNGTQIVVVTVESLEGDAIEDYAYDLFNDWGIGDKEKDNGILILLSVGDRNIRIEVGDGLEGIFNDAKVGRMIDSLARPYFAENDFDTGIKELYGGIIEVLGNPEAYSEEESGIGEIIGSIVLVILLILVSFIKGGRGGRWRRGWGGFGGYGGWGGHGGFGGFGGGSSGGGFGGFGGGSSSGGGASRRF